MPSKTRIFHLYSDTSKFQTGSALYQIQNDKPKLIVYVSKRLTEAANGYSITELELCGLAINIANLSHLLKRVDFDPIVDHLALMHIIKSKIKLATKRIKRLLELISSYSFNPFVNCYKLHVHTDAFLAYFLYINIHILDIYIDVSIYVCVHICTCMYRCYMTA